MYVEESVVAVTSILASGQSAVGSLTGTKAVELAIGDATGVTDDVALADAIGDGETDGSELELPLNIHHTPVTTVRATNTTAPRRTQ